MSKTTTSNKSILEKLAGLDRGDWRTIFHWSPLLWPFVFVLIVLLFVPNVPIHWVWDNFTYLAAVHDGGNHVFLGWGRTTFILMGHFAKLLGMNVLWPDLFSTWRVWLSIGLILHAFTLVPLTLVLIRWIGPMATHIAMGLFVIYPQQILVLFGVWAENQALTAFLIAALILSMRAPPMATRLVLSGFFAVLMVLLKEVNIYYVPFLALLAFWTFPRTEPLPRRLLRACLYGAIIIILSLIVYFLLLPWIFPGMNETRRYLEERYFGMETVGIGAAPRILSTIIRVLWVSGTLLPLCILILPWAAIHLTSWRLRLFRSHLPLVTLALVLTGVPLAILLTSGQVEMMDRQVLALLPGLALLAALPWARPLPPSLAHSFRRRVVLTTLILLIMLVVSKWSLVREYSFNSQLDARRYHHMESLLHERTGLWVGADSWPAHYLSLYGPEAPRPPLWDIIWPDWTEREIEEEALAWRDRQVAHNRRVALSESIVRNLDRDIEEIFLLFPGYTFTLHPSGWWVGMPQD